MCLVLSLTVPISVSAGGVWGSLNSTQKKICKEGWAYLRLDTSKADKKTKKKKGNKPEFSKELAAGILGNVDQESGFDNSATNRSGDTHGYIQMKTDAWLQFRSWAKSHGLDPDDIAVQLRYALGNIRDSSWKTYVSSPTHKEWTKCTDIVMGMEGFMVAYERCTSAGATYKLQKVKNKVGGSGARYQDGDSRITYAKSIYKALTGSDPKDTSVGSDGGDSSKGKDGSKGSSGKDSQAQVIAELKAIGAYDEKQIEAFTKLNETPIESKYLIGASRDGLDQTRTTGLSDWEDNVRLLSGDSLIIRILRVIIVGIGICMVVWSLFLYTAYWFDRINVFFDIDLLGILSFGRLHKSDNELECTFQMKDFGKTNTMTVNHKAILRICIFSIMIGVSIVSGLFYKILGGFVNGIIRFFGG